MSEIVNEELKELTSQEVAQNELTKVAKQKAKTSKTKTKEEIKRENDLKLVRGRFEFNEIAGKGAFLEFSYGSMYKDVPIFKYSKKDGTELVDGQVYELPYVVAQHLIDNGKYQIDENAKDEQGNSKVKIKSWVRRYNFVPVDFVDVGFGHNSGNF